MGKKRAPFRQQQQAKQQPAIARQPAPVRSPAGDRWLAYATLPLRLFLGATFVYAAIQKISDPGFLQPGSATYIGTQLQAFAAQSPIGFLIEIFALPTPQLTGIGVIAAELAIGALVIAGIATRWAAAGGALVNFVFFLTASWTVQPYFLGSDSIYTVAWITLAIVGDQGVFTARPLLFGEATSRRPVDLERRRLLLQLGGAAVAAVWVMGLLPRIRHTPSGGQASTSPEASPTAAASPTGTKVGSLSDLQARGFLNFQDPKSGDPAVAVSLSSGSVVAFDAICTHAGCQVSYDTGQKVLACPCHGALFDPAHGAAVLAGPAPTPLPSIPLQVGSDGGLYAD
ncbi:MAG TPA: TQO small subunit DoxD [Candidatus Dormibacteraeota bacterium]|nr:TQO small subunit DoxD [Candidatus Dormibacteraeota bacterium]